MKIIKTKLLTQFGKEFNLTFDKKHYYCTSNAYKDDKGEFIKSYYYYNHEVYGLKYFDGCFNPFLVKHNKSNFVLIISKNELINYRGNKHYLRNLYKSFGEDLTEL